MGALYSCCWQSYCHQKKEENNYILRHETKAQTTLRKHSSKKQTSRTSGSSSSDPDQEGLCSGTVQDEWVSMGGAESDVELQAFIVMRNEADTYTEEWEKLNYDIHTLRYTKREVISRWRKILIQLGYQREVDSLLTVNRQHYRRSLNDSDSLNRAREMLQATVDGSSLFPQGVASSDRYLFVMDRLVSLDS
uniref:Melanoregulin n=2 Tax=Esox lucius TaxID=8010 RepID=A0A3P8Y784_ESOLU